MAKKACGCQGTQDPYQESLSAVWHDPTQYDPHKHGPSYLPKMASSDKALVRNVIPRVLSPKTAQALFPHSDTPLTGLLAILRAASMIHQTHHWQTSGSQFYGDHLLFERLYSESQAFIDQVAERAVGSSSSSAVDVVGQARSVAVIVANLSGGKDPQGMVDASLRAESLVVQAVTMTLRLLETSGSLTNGTDNLLQGISDAHEGFVYLLKQRSSTVAYDYGR